MTVRHQLRQLVLLLPALLIGIAANPAAAQTASSPQLQFTMTPYLWISGVTGTIKTPNPNIPTQNVEAGFGNLLSHLDAVPIMGAAELRYGRFGLLADIMAISVKADISTHDLLFSGGSARLTQVIGSVLGVYRVVDSSRRFADLGVGVRAFSLSTEFSLKPGLLPGFSRSPGTSWADPIVGARYHVNFGDQWGLTAYGDVGGGINAQLTWQLLGTVDYRITRSTVMRIGYRHLQFQYRGNALHQNMGLSGPILGATIQF